jgi:CBS domain-containing protein
MQATNRPLQALCAADLMDPAVPQLLENMAMGDAARLLVQKQTGAAPVVDGQGTCVGVLSATDFVRLAVNGAELGKLLSPPLPVACPFQVKRRLAGDEELTQCLLPPGVCPVQATPKKPGAEELVICTQPHCVLTDWQLVEVENVPEREVRRFMTPNPVTARPATSIHALARMMIDAHIHRIIVVDEEQKPIGIVSNANILAALACSDGSR